LNPAICAGDVPALLKGVAFAQEFEMKKWLTEILVCPSCLPRERRLRVNIYKEYHDDFMEGELICEQCGRSYPVRDGIAFLQIEHPGEIDLDNRYESSPVLSSYLWSHYGDLLKDEEAFDTYVQWAGLIRENQGFCLDIGSAVGRFVFEMSKKSRFVVGIDNSISFIRAARELMVNRGKIIPLLQEGNLVKEEKLTLPAEWDMENIEFIVGDAMALPFRTGAFSALSSLNLIDKVPVPMKHFTEMNRVAQETDVQFLFSDPFSWSEYVAQQEDWLGGKMNGNFSGRGMDNVISLLEGKKGDLLPQWRVIQQGHVWWKIRTHINHFELIRSCFVKAER
jgi:uncharacterized protein YbaR (Trm112 family)